MATIFAQGDILLERVDDVVPDPRTVVPRTEGAVVIAEGELTGHRHSIFGNVTFFRDDALARDIPDPLYLGHLVVESPSAELVHQEHAPISLLKGTYRVRRQRELAPADAWLVAD